MVEQDTKSLPAAVDPLLPVDSIIRFDSFIYINYVYCYGFDSHFSDTEHG
jgi:hypothetical protein